MVSGIAKLDNINFTSNVDTEAAPPTAALYRGSTVCQLTQKKIQLTSILEGSDDGV
jgi:hypothetical protein